ncbi:hypothetical protein GSI_09686 [Ganoderma sinense ZZ0214-1]|uniref:Vacuolar protein sorting-associated protein 41 n=1 Tax=Ganoderma sinense ZZ0214-1 TaxID=1077348 RepID=A0A2G8S300_9APHY|nr:hypothetical protein GSI_09686 [Ganoderma sinense ZZ0214-1]
MSAKPGDNGVANPTQEDEQNAGICASPDNMTEVSSEDGHGEEDGVGTNGSVAGENGQATESEEYGSEEDVTDEEDQEDEDEDDDEEPALKYERLGGISHQLLQKDSASALAYANQRLALGTHGGKLHVLDLAGQPIKSFAAHSASVLDISMDITGDWIATASIDGQVAVYSLSNPETYVFNMKRPLRTVALEPNFAKSSTRSLVSGGMAGNLILHEKGWLGYKETVLHSGEGPVWQVRWCDHLIAWANDLGVKIYDTHSQSRITFIDRPADSPRADLFKCTLHWQDENTLLIGWADQIKVARVRTRPRKSAASNLHPLLVEITAVFQLDCMISGIVPHLMTPSPSAPQPRDTAVKNGSVRSTMSPILTSFLVVAYTVPDTALLTGNEATADRAEQARKLAERPELRIISRGGEELSADALGISGYERWGCNDYVLVDIDAAAAKGSSPSSSAGHDGDRYYIVLSPRDIVVVKPRDWRDHVAWLVERKRYEEALDVIERMGQDDSVAKGDKDDLDAVQIGERYIEHLVGEGDFVKAARLCPKVCGQDSKRWENWIFVFAQKHELQAIIPFIPTESPTLGHLVYEMILAHFLTHDRQTLLQTIKTWPKGIYDVPAVIVAVQSELDRAPSSSSKKATGPETVILMECLAELYTLNRQPGKALPYFLRLRRPNVFDLIRENNLFTDVQDQALLLVEFDQELREKRKKDGEDVDTDPVAAITLLVDHIHSIPMARVAQQLQDRPYYLYLYLNALFQNDPHLTSPYADTQVKLYAEYAPRKLIDFLRASSYYSLEEAYKVCNERDLVLEMVFLLGRMGNNKKALHIIIERLGDVNRAIDFAKEQHDDDLWEDLLRYSETRPAFIRGLLENVGAEIDPIRLIRRIKNGLEIPGLKSALIKILHDFTLQVSLLEGCQTILNGDCADFVQKLNRNQTSGFFLSDCVQHDEDLPHQPDPTLVGMGIGGQPGLSGKVAFTAILRARLPQGCPVCHKRSEGQRT